MDLFPIVGKDVPRTEAPLKARGAAIYADDIKLPGMLYGALLRSPLPHARIAHIDVTGSGLSLGNQLIAWTAKFQGNGTFDVEYNGAYPSPLNLVFLVE